MRNLTLISLLSILLLSCASKEDTLANTDIETSNEITLPTHIPANQALYDTIAALDKIYNQAYNNLNDSIIIEIVTEDFEYYHDQGGTTFSKNSFAARVRKSIFSRKENDRKVLVKTVEGSIEVYEIPEYGAIQLSKKQFMRENDEDWSEPSRAITFWKKMPKGWLQSKRVSLHPTSDDK